MRCEEGGRRALGGEGEDIKNYSHVKGKEFSLHNYEVMCVSKRCSY